jgi:hypothetical protein
MMFANLVMKAKKSPGMAVAAEKTGRRRRLGNEGIFCLVAGTSIDCLG